MLNLVQHLIKSMAYETLKRPMKQVQGMVQGDVLRVLGQPHTSYLLFFVTDPVKKPYLADRNWGPVEIFLLKVYGWLEESLPFRRFRSSAVSMSLW